MDIELPLDFKGFLKWPTANKQLEMGTSMPTPDRKLRVFLCHASQDKPIVRELYEQTLAESWVDPWLDKQKFFAGKGVSPGTNHKGGSRQAAHVVYFLHRARSSSITLSSSFLTTSLLGVTDSFVTGIVRSKALLQPHDIDLHSL